MKKEKIKLSLGPKGKRILSAVGCALLAAAVIAAVIVFAERKKNFESNTKNAISMGTVVTSKVYGKLAAVKNEEILSIIDGLDKTISWRVDGSAVDQVNDGKTVRLNELAQILGDCQRVSEKSGGAFDVSIGPVSRLWDFGGENERKPSDEEIKKALKSVDYGRISCSNGIVSVGEEMLLDLGAVGKGYACDMVRAYLEGKGADGAVVSVGGSILAFGKRNKAGDKWRVAIRHPREESAFLGTILLDEGFVSTSGDYEKFFELDGKRYHHILDARTGYPAESDLISVTIVSDNGLMSDALSTACFILGSEKGKALAEEFEAGAVFVDSDMNVSIVGDVEFERSE